MPLLLAACESTPPPDTSPSDTQLKQRRFSEFDTQFAHTPYDFRCGDCQLMARSNGCESIPRVSMIVRATVLQRRVVNDHCDPSDHDFSAHCIAAVELDLRDAEVVRAAGTSSPPSTVHAEFSYASPPSGVPQFSDQQPRYLFLQPDGPTTVAPKYFVLAMCPGFSRP